MKPGPRPPQRPPQIDLPPTRRYPRPALSIARLAAVLLALGLAAAPLTAQAQQAAPAWRAPRVGVIASRTGFEAFRAGLRELAYTEGRDITLEFRSTGTGDVDYRALTTGLVRDRVDVIVAVGAATILAAQRATAAIPIVGLSVDPGASGLGPSLAPPRGNVTGLSFNEVGTTAKRLELLREAVPSITRVAALANPANPTSKLIVEETERAARPLGVQVRVLELARAEDIEEAFARMTAWRADALLVLPSALAFAERTRLVALAIRRRLPSMFWRREFVDVGGLMAYGPDQGEMYRRAAVLVSRILQGARPADLPVEPPRRFGLILNLETAKALGLAIPRPVLLLADEVIENR